MSADPQPSPLPHTYTLYVSGEAVATLQWRAGWYLRAGHGPWRRLAVDAELDAADADDLLADLSIAFALDAAARFLRGPAVRRSQPLRPGRYEMHVSGLAPDLTPLAFPETIAVTAGDVTVLAGSFDDQGLTLIARRVALLGGRLLALFHADDTG